MRKNQRRLKSDPSFALTLALLLFLAPGNCFGKAPNLLLKNKAFSFNQSDYLLFFDSTSYFSIDQVGTWPESRFSFNPQDFHPNIHQHLWLRLDLQVSDSLDSKWVFELFNHRAEELILFFKNSKNQLIPIDTIGSNIPFYHRNLHERFPTFEVPLHAGKNTLYLKYKSKHFLGLNTSLQPYRDYINFANEYYFIIGGFYFILFILLLYNLLFFISTQDRIYLYYILFVIASALDCLKVDQIGFALFWPNHPEVNSYMEDYARTLFVLGIVNYASYFLAVRKDFPRLYATLWTFVLIFFFHQSILGIVFPNLPFALLLTELLIFSMLSMLLYVAIVRLKQGNKPVRIFLIGFVSLFTGFVVTYSFYSGWIQGNHLVYYILFYGIVTDTFMFSFALSSRLRQERLEKERALEAENEAKRNEIEWRKKNEVLLNKVNAELEQKVQERTLEIEESKLKLSEQAAIISQLNVGLHKENWDLSKTVKSLRIRKVIPENQTYAQMQELFPSEEECFKFLAGFKWEQGFQCRKCGNRKEVMTNDFYSRRCSKCGTIESITAHTIFHKLKFPLDKAFYIAYAVFMWKEDLNASDLARELDLNYRTCLKFKLKIEDALESRKKEGLKAKSWEELILEN